HVVFVLSKGYAPRLDYGHLREAVLADWGGDADASASVGVDCPQLTPMQVRQTIIKVRNEKLPRVGVVGSAGSFFKNPIVERSCYEKICSLVPGVNVPHYEVEDKVKIPAAWLIEQCGWKGKRSGNAGVWEKQALVLVNATGLALPEEIIRLENKIKLSVKERFGIELSPEVEHL
ncbi:MAG: hypothetical protein II364_02405, partial [Bacteroidales bacterium]|nr:hypothetical protein [Bacteroidales bacterium]